MVLGVAYVIVELSASIRRPNMLNKAPVSIVRVSLGLIA